MDFLTSWWRPYRTIEFYLIFVTRSWRKFMMNSESVLNPGLNPWLNELQREIENTSSAPHHTVDTVSLPQTFCQNDSWSRTSYINAITELMACYFIQFTKSSFNALLTRHHPCRIILQTPRIENIVNHFQFVFDFYFKLELKSQHK